MDDKTTELLMGYFKNSTDAVKEIVSQLNRSNQVIIELTRKIDEMKSDLSEYDLEEIKKELRFLVKESEQLFKAISDENKASTKTELIEMKQTIEKKITSTKDEISAPVQEIKSAIEKVEMKLILAASGAVTLVSVIFEFVKFFFFKKES